MKKKIKLLLNILPISFVLLTLTGCSNNNTAKIGQPAKSSDDKDNASINQAIAEKTLAITLHKCSGCGKCVRVDPEHFMFDNNIRKAAVISTKNLDSQNLTVALSICRDRAIELI